MTKLKTWLLQAWARIKPRRWLAVLLAVSLGINLFVAGWAGIRWAAWGWGWHHFGGVVSDRHDDGGREGRRSGKALLRELWQAHGAEALQLAERSVPHMQEVADALVQEPFDPARFDTAVRALEDLGQGFVALAGGTIRDGAGRMTVDQRQDIAQRIRRSAVRLERRLERWEDRLLQLPQ